MGAQTNRNFLILTTAVSLRLILLLAAQSASAQYIDTHTYITSPGFIRNLQAKANYFRIFPQNLDFVPSSNAEQQVNERNSKFCWRSIRVGQSGEAAYRVLTIEEGLADLYEDRQYLPINWIKLKTYNLHTAHSHARDYSNRVEELVNTKFNIREKTRDGTKFKIVTIEDDTQETNSNNIYLYPIYSPFDFVGTGDFRDTFTQEHSEFNWRQIQMDDEVIYRAITIEENENQN